MCNVSSVAICGGFYSKRLTGNHAAEPCTQFYMGTCLAVQLLTMAIPRICLLRLAKEIIFIGVAKLTPV